MTTEPRDSIRLQQNRQGVVDPNVTSETLFERAMECLFWGDEPRKGLEAFWAEEPAKRPLIHSLKHRDGDLRCVRILDSFFSDTLAEPDIRPHLFKRALYGVHVEFLLANPVGAFGAARANAINQDAQWRSAEGLLKLARACNNARTLANRSTGIQEKDIRQLDPQKDWEKIAKLLLDVLDGLPVSVRLYDKSPSGPYYFFGDLLLAGRFWAGNTAAFYPWAQITDTPYANDLYDTMLAEYYEIWNGASELGSILGQGGLAGHRINAKRVFISYSGDDKDSAFEIMARLEDRGVEAYCFQTDLAAGDEWPEELRHELRACDTLVAVVSSAVVANKEWIRAEIGAAWVLHKRIVVARLGTKEDILPGILRYKWSDINLGSAKGLEQLVQSLAGV